MDRREEILKIFPKELRQVLGRLKVRFEDMQEIRLRAGQPVFLICAGQEYCLGPKGELLGRERQEEALFATGEQIGQAVEYMGGYSLYAAEDELRQGFITIQGGHRIGVAGRVVADRQQIKLVKFISFINVRVAHEIKGCADPVMEGLYGEARGPRREERRFLNTLIVSPPRMGKTTLLRDIIRQVSAGRPGIFGMTVGVVDERSELGACYQGRPQNDLGPRTDILDCCPKAQGMRMLVRSMSPQVVAVDEIGSGEDVQAIDEIRSCGCALAATVHGGSLEEVREKPGLGRLVREGCFERFILLSRDQEGRRCMKMTDGAGRELARAWEGEGKCWG